MNKKVYGLIGIRAIRANWNADFDGFPRQMGDKIWATDKALKYVMRNFWADSEGKKVFYKKSTTDDDKTLTQEERYKQLFGDYTSKTSKEFLETLFECDDIRQFGCLIAFKSKKSNGEDSKNIGIHGAVQIGHGINKYEDTNTEVFQVLSPFASDTDKGNSTIGSASITDEAYYFYNFSINPNHYKELQEKYGDKMKYTEDDYNNFRKAALNGATLYNSTSKAGCDNFFGLFIETDTDCYLPDLTNYIKVSKNNDEIIVNLRKIFEFMPENKVKKIEIYKDTITKIEGIDNNKKIEIKNIYQC